MKKKIFLTIIFLLFKSYLTYSQISLENEDIAAYKNISQEKIFVHQNTTFLLTGENLYYKVYCINVNSNRLSDISKIAYVELVGTDKISIFKHKIRLNDGLGQGDFLIPTNIPSGNYKLIAYTQWMKNSQENQFFQSDISIINPFQENQSSILEKNTTDEVQNLSLKKENIDYNNSLNTAGSDYIDLTTNANSFKNREKVVLTIKSLKSNLSDGNYSISVRKIDPLQISKRLTANTYMSLYPQKASSKTRTNASIYLPELRGDLLSGKVIYKDTKLASPNTKVALSIQGKQSIFKIATANDLGVFYFNIPEIYENPDAIIQIIGSEKNNFKMTMHEYSSINMENLNFFDFKITPKIKDYLLERSIYDQIESAYSDIKPNTFKNLDSLSPIYNSKAKIYNLDDYTRFPTIKETFVEIIKEVYIKQKNGKRTFHVRLYNQLFESELPALVLVDGVLIQNHNELLNLSAMNIRKISVLNNTYIFDSMIVDGVISIDTFNGDYLTDLSGTFIEKFHLFKPLIRKNYYNQLYDNNKNSDRIPDYRSQLLWVPDFNLNNEEDYLYFYTSDNNGDYEICLEGFTKEGMPVSLRKIISIK